MAGRADRPPELREGHSRRLFGRPKTRCAYALNSPTARLEMGINLSRRPAEARRLTIRRQLKRVAKSLTRLSHLLNAAAWRPRGLERAGCSFGRGAVGEEPTQCYAMTNHEQRKR